MDDKLIEGQIPKDIDFSSLRTGYRTYEIEISHDDEGNTTLTSIRLTAWKAIVFL